MQRAATELGVKSHKTGFDGGWELRWTPTPVSSGRGSTLKAEGPAFKIYGVRESKAEGGRQKAEGEGDGKAMNYGVAEDAQFESQLGEANSPRFCEDAQLAAEDAHRGFQSAGKPTEMADSEPVEALEEAC